MRAGPYNGWPGPGQPCSILLRCLLSTAPLSLSARESTLSPLSWARFVPEVSARQPPQESCSLLLYLLHATPWSASLERAKLSGARMLCFPRPLPACSGSSWSGQDVCSHFGSPNKKITSPLPGPSIKKPPEQFGHCDHSQLRVFFFKSQLEYFPFPQASC